MTSDLDRKAKKRRLRFQIAGYPVQWSKFLKLSVFAHFVWLCGADVVAMEIYVEQSASILGDGSFQRPYRSLQDGIDAAQPGDIVRVGAGTYDAISSVRDATAENRITIIARERRKVFVNADGRALDVSHHFHTFVGIVFDAGYGPQQAVRANGADYLELLDVEVHRGTKNCVDLGTIRNVTIANSKIHHCINYFDPEKNADSHGITGSSVFNLTVRNTDIFMLTGDALQLSPSRSAWDNVYIEGCRLWTGVLEEAINGWAAGQAIGENAIDTKVGPSVLNGQGERPKLSVVDTIAYGWQSAITNQAAYNIKENVDVVLDRVTVFDSELAFRLRAPALVRVQNAVIHNVDYAFRLEDGLKDAHIVNSTVGTAIRRAAFKVVSGSPQNLVIKNQLFLGPEVPALAATRPSNMALGEDAFVDLVKNDYRLRPGAAAVDGGELVLTVYWDRDGQSRPQGDRYDVGAYEMNPAAVPPDDQSTTPMEASGRTRPGPVTTRKALTASRY